jgi:hypothetical protein
MVEIVSSSLRKSSSVNRRSKDDLPTDELPVSHDAEGASRKSASCRDRWTVSGGARGTDEK